MAVVSPSIGDAICFFVSRLPTCVPPKRNIMNAKSKTWIVGVWALCLCACADNNPSVTDEPSVPVPVPIGFSSDVASAESPQTRGTVLTAIDKVRLFASYTGTADWGPSSSYSFDYMYDQLLTKSSTDGSWTYSPLKYWPVNSADKISFFAYAPEEAKAYISVSSASTTNPKFTYTLPAKESDKLDLLVAGTLNCTNATKKVSLSMKHALTQVTFKAKNGAPANISNITLSAATVTMPGTGTLTFNSASVPASASGTFTWTPDTSTGKLTTFTTDETLGGGKTISLGTSTDAKLFATFFLLPVGNPSGTATLKLTYNLTKTGEASVTLNTVLPMPATPLWNPGTSIVYTVSIIDDRLLIDDAVSVKAFENGTTGLPDGDISAT